VEKGSKVVFDGYDIQSLKDITHAREQKSKPLVKDAISLKL
jgi:hypothetical protein